MAHFKLLLMTMATVMLISLRVNGDAVVTGSVFCDICRDGEVSMFDYPLYGSRVMVACPAKDGTNAPVSTVITNWMGGYVMRINGDHDLSQCTARVVGGPAACGASAGTEQGLSLMFSMFGTEMYAVGPLVSQPSNPMPMCPSAPVPTPVAPTPREPTPATPTPLVPTPRVPTPATPTPPVLTPAEPTPSTPSPRSPGSLFPSVEASACSFDKWMMPEFRCYWRLLSPSTPVAFAFGPVAAGKYGNELTLSDALQGRGDTYRTLLREATTALLNSYNSLGFSYPTLAVIEHTNWALLGSPQEALLAARRFMRANQGASETGTVPCTFTPCS